MQHASGFLHSLRSSHQVVSHYPVFQGYSMLPELLFLPGSNIPSLLPRPRLSSVKWIMCFLSTLNQAPSTVCHHPVFHVGDKVQILPHALWVIHTLLFITCFRFLTCINCFLPILDQTHQEFSIIQCFHTVTYFKNFATHHCSEVPNSLSASHASVRGLASSASSQPQTKHTQWIITIHCFSPVACFMCFFILSRWSTCSSLWPLNVSILWQIPGRFHPHQAKHTQTLTPSNVLLCVTFLKSSSLSHVKHIHNIHHLQFQCQDPLQWCVHSPHLKAFTRLSPYSVEVQWHACSASPSIQCQAQLVVTDHLTFHCMACFSQMCPRLFKRKRKRNKKKPLFKGWSVQLSHSGMSSSLLSHEPQQARPPCPSSTPMGNPNPCPLSRWYHPSISPSDVPFSSCPQSFPATRCFQMSQLFTSRGQIIGVSASTSVLSMNTKDWFLLGWTGWIS